MSAIELTIDGRSVQVMPGQTLLQAASKLGIEVPTLCYLERCGPLTTCLVCLVKCTFHGQSKLTPACATPAQQGMIVESESAEVHEARRTALELLLSDHVGDCLSPCQRICPLHLDIPLMLRLVNTGRMPEATALVRSSLPLPAVLGRLCHHPCEGGCRRCAWDEPAAIREVERHVADASLQAPASSLPSREKLSGKTVAIVGSGPTGLAAAYYLLRDGHACTVVDRRSKAGGTLRSGIGLEALPSDILDRELEQFVALGLQFKPGIEFGSVVTLEGLQRGFDAVLLAIGELQNGEGRSFGVELTAAGVKVNPLTYQTNVPNVFAAGSAVKAIKQVVRAMAEGKAAAECITQYLSGSLPRPKQKPFSSVIGRLQKAEVETFMQSADRAPRQSTPCSGCGGLGDAKAPVEAGRCMHCDCRAAGDCALQRFATRYGAHPGRFPGQRRSFELHMQPGNIIYEPGKCILCGVCVKLTEMAREPLGLTFIGRGFDVRVSAPFNRTIADGLQRVAAECVEHCPTGALVFKKTPSTCRVPHKPLAEGSGQP